MGKRISKIYLRKLESFLDDRERPSYRNKVKPEELLETLNFVNKAVQFTMKFSDKEILFLDIWIKRDSSGVWMDLYQKPTNAQRYLPYSQVTQNIS